MGNWKKFLCVSNFNAVFRDSNVSVILKKWQKKHVISSFRRELVEICALLGSNATNSGNSLPTFRDNLSVSSSTVKNQFLTLLSIPWPLEFGPIGCPETSVSKYHYWLRYSPGKRSSQQQTRRISALYCINGRNQNWVPRSEVFTEV